MMRCLLRFFVMACGLTAALISTSFNSTIHAQTPWSTDIQLEWLQQVLPAAETFSEKAGDPPVFSGFRRNPVSDEQELVGYVFLSSDVPPERRGYAAPIAMLIGLSTEYQITAIKVLNYYESYLYSRGDFIDNSTFLAQFRNKTLTDQFRLQQDFDGLSSATITSAAMIRGVSDAARRVARTYLQFEEGDEQERNTAANALAQLQPLSWQNMIDQGIITQMTAPTMYGDELQLSFTYIGKRVLGEFFIGAEAFSGAESDAAFRAGRGELMLYAASGDGAGNSFRQFPITIQQGDISRTLPGYRMVNAGDASAGAIAGNARYAGAIAMHPDFDITHPFTIILQPPGLTETFSVVYQLSGIGLPLARGEAILSEEEIREALLAEAGFFQRLQLDPPWQGTPPLDIAMLMLIFTLVMIAFLRKSSRVRWVALTLTLFYLGFFKAGFLSVSHITSAIRQGPDVFLNNMPLLMLIIFTLVTTLLWGRIFCSSLCPFGAVQDFLARFSPKSWRITIPQNFHAQAIYIKYAILVLILGLALTQSNLTVFQYFEPFGTLFFFSPSLLLWAILLAILLACVLVERFYCRYVCPLGAALGVIALVSPLRINRVPQCTLCTVCEHACPTGAIRKEKIDFKECVRCDICESKLIEKAGTCRHSMTEITRRVTDKQKLEVVDLR